MSRIELYQEEVFENIKNINEYGEEFWHGRDLQKVLKYKE